MTIKMLHASVIDSERQFAFAEFAEDEVDLSTVGGRQLRTPGSALSDPTSAALTASDASI